MNQEKLVELGFKYYATNADLLFYNSLVSTLSLFRKHIGESFLVDVSSQLNYPNFSICYDLVKKELIRIFGEPSSDVILTEVKEHIQDTIGHYENKSLQEILAEIKKSEISTLIHDMNSPEKVLLLWKTEQFKDHLFCEFFNRDGSENIFFGNSEVPIMKSRIIPYDKILEDISVAIQKEIELTNQVCQFSKSPTVFVGAEDMTNWFNAGLTNEFLNFRRCDSDYFKEKSIYRLCGLNIAKNVDKEIISKVAPLFNTIIVEEPLLIYKQKL